MIRSIVACRSEEKGKAAVEEIQLATGNDKIEFMKLDLLSLAAVKTFADEFKSKHNQLHILLNNAGVMGCPFGLSEDGIETNFATNYVAHYYLTMLLLPVLIESKPSRIVNVSAKLHKATSFKTMSLDKVNDEKAYSKIFHYAFSKACNILFTRELTKQLESKGINDIYVNSGHPGVVRTEMSRHLASPTSIVVRLFNALVTISPEDGALTQLYLATSPEVESKDVRGEYYVPYGVPGSVNEYSSSDKNAKELWEFTEKLLKEKAPDYQGFL
ncbi:hypothetical protein BJV82DRAFT_586528 [Fennellomyces sp. T-0311]|nr:hypothetical protein BJV82DRAFT_586528 [Fennellomyces sp. T-0311]